MKILTITASDNPVGGASRIAVDLHRAFLERGHESTMLVGKKFTLDSNCTTIMRTKFDKINAYLRSNDFNFFKTDYLLEMNSFLEADVIQCHNLNGWFFNLGTMIKMSLIKPVIWTLHDMWALTPHCGHTESEQLENGLLTCSNPKLYPTTLWNNDQNLSFQKNALYSAGRFHLVAPCNWLKTWVEKTSLNNKTISIINNGVDTNIFKPQDKYEARSCLGLKGKRIVLFLGASAINNPYKGYEDFCWLASENWGADTVFYAVGGQNNDPDGHVFCIQGSEDKSLIAQYIAASDVLVLPSRHEVFPLVVLESLAVGTPVVAYGVGGVPESIDGIRGCRVVEKFNRVRLKAALIDVFNELSLHGNSISLEIAEIAKKKYSNEKMTEKYLELYREGINNWCHR